MPTIIDLIQGALSHLETASKALSQFNSWRQIEVIDYSANAIDGSQNLFTALVLDEQPLTAARLELSYADPPFQRVYSVGMTPTLAIMALGEKISWGVMFNFEPQSVAHPDREWYMRFTADGTSMKAGGRYVPGGVILDWWK